MRKFGLIGYPLTHSFSKGYFTNKFTRENLSDCEYLNFPLPSLNDFRSVIDNNPDLLGINVTIPYKEQIIPYLDELDQVSGTIGAVNTIKIINTPGKKYLKGFNSDVFGFSGALKKILPTRIENALVLGTGGASKAITHALCHMGIKVLIVSRKEGHLSYQDLGREILAKHNLIVNTTPLGTFPDTQTFPEIPYEYLTSENILFDLVYNPAESVFLKKGREKHAITSNGLEMLHLQAEKSWEIWNSPE